MNGFFIKRVLKPNIYIKHKHLLWKLLILFYFPFGLNAFPINLSDSKFYVREGFQEDWVKQVPEACTECKLVSFTNEAFKTIRIKNIFPDKYNAANELISLEERVADQFTIGTNFHLDKIPELNSPIGIFLERIGINWEIYLNGHLLKSEIYLNNAGKVNKHKATRYPLVQIPNEYLRLGENYLHFRIIGDIRDSYLGVFLNSPEIDNTENLRFRQLDFFRFFLHTSYLVLGLLYFILFVLHREQKYNLYFSLGLLLYGIYRFADSHLCFYLVEDSSVQQNLFSIPYLILSGTMLVFFNSMIDDKIHWLTKLSLLVFLLLTIVKLFLPHAYTFPFLLNIAGNAALIVFPYLVFYRIGYVGLTFFIKTYRTRLKEKTPCAFYSSFQHSWNTKIEFVLLLLVCPSYSSFIIDYVYFTKFDAIFYASDFTFITFYGLMAFFTYRRRFLLVERHKRELEKLNWEKETERLRAELAIKEERENIFADIHDNLGGKLLDLSFQLNKIEIDKPVEMEIKNKIRERINEVLKGLRNRLLAFEDMENIEDNFIDGIQNFLVRRYTLIGRKINFTFNSNIQILKLNKIICKQIINILQEIVNNDLKYGIGKSSWTFMILDNRLYVQLDSRTNWDKVNLTSGHGKKTIPLRLNEINGTFSEKIENGNYSTQIQLPI